MIFFIIVSMTQTGLHSFTHFWSRLIPGIDFSDKDDIINVQAGSFFVAFYMHFVFMSLCSWV